MQNGSNHIISWHKYPFLFLLLFMALGICWEYLFLPSLSFSSILIAVIFLIIVLIVLQLIKSVTMIYQIANIVSIALIMVSLGIALSHSYHANNDKKWYGHKLDKTTALKVFIQEEPDIKDKIVTIQIAVNAIEVNHQWQNANGKLLLHFFKNTYTDSLKVGDELIIPNELDSIKNSNNPFAFKYADYLKLQNLYHQCFLAEDDALLIPNKNYSSTFLQKSSQKINDIITQNVKDSTAASLLYATILNDRSALDPELRSNYAKSGVAHIIAISGLHVGIVLIMIMGLFYFVTNKKYHWIKYAIAIPVIWLYIAITGFPPSAIRAGVMFTILTFGRFLYRPANTKNNLFATAFILLIYRPWWLFDVGFQLSFVAVLSILIFYKPIYQWLTIKNKILNYFWQIIVISLSVQVLIFPLVMYYFHQFPLFGILANVPATIFSFVFMFLGIALVILGLAGIPVGFLGAILGFITTIFNQFIVYVVQISPTKFYELYIDKVEFWLIIIGILLLAAFWLAKKKWTLFAGLGVCLLFIFLLNVKEFQHLQQRKFVIFQSNNKLLTATITGKSATLFSNAILNKKDTLYTLLPAKMGYGISSITTNYNQSIWQIEDKIALLIDGELQNNAAKFKVDYLILSGEEAIDIEKIQNTFQPEKIILSNGLKRYNAQNLSEALASKNIDYWNVYTDGAFVLE